MGHLRAPRRVSPLVTVLATRPAWLAATRAPLEALLGPLALESQDFLFDGTAYYASTMGSPLLRRFYLFKERFDPGVLADWKLACNQMEEEFATQFQSTDSNVPERPVNIDPGYIDGSKLVLASTKDFAHRIYLRDGIFAEITAGYRDNKWETYYFTFPDFKAGHYFPFLTQARAIHCARTHPRRRRKYTDRASYKRSGGKA